MPRVVVLLVLLGLPTTFACNGGGSVVTDGSAALPSDGGGGPVYVPCTTLCFRPGDCALAYPDDDYCPTGFRCALTSSCVTDGGTGD